MLVTVLLWIYIWLTSTVVGYFLVHHVNRRPESISSLALPLYSILGIACITVVDSYLSIFIATGLTINALLLISSSAIIVVYQKELKSLLKLSNGLGNWGVFSMGAVTFLLLFWNSQETNIADTSGYHAQSVRWIEQFKAVKGLGNLHDRYAFNSHWFIGCAVYSFSFFGKGSFHPLNGYWVFLVVWYLYIVVRKTDSTALTLTGLGLVVLTLVKGSFGAMSCFSLSPDFILISCIWIVCLEYLQRPQSASNTPFLLALLCIWAVTVKLSGIVLGMVALLAIGQSVWQKNHRKSWSLILGGIVIVLPFFVRNIILSGYLIFPFAQI